MAAVTITGVSTGICSGCQLPKRLDADGMVVDHITPSHLRVDPAEREPCVGVGLPAVDGTVVEGTPVEAPKPVERKPVEPPQRPPAVAVQTRPVISPRTGMTVGEEVPPVKPIAPVTVAQPSPSAAPVRQPSRGPCRICNKVVALDTDGRARSHRDLLRLWCDGRGRLARNAVVSWS